MIVAVIALVAVVVALLVERTVMYRTYARHVETLTRSAIARTATEAATAERIVESRRMPKPEREHNPPPVGMG